MVMQAQDDPRRVVYAPHRITRAAYRSLIAGGHIDADARVELLDGVIEDMSPQGPHHRSTNTHLLKLLVQQLPDAAAVTSQASFAASSYDEPEPDIAIVPAAILEDEDLTQAHCIIEICVTSRHRDLAKARMYAHAAVPQYIVVDVPKRLALVYRDPQGDAYNRVDTTREGARIVIDAFPDVGFDLAEVLPKAQGNT